MDNWHLCADQVMPVAARIGRGPSSPPRSGAEVWLGGYGRGVLQGRRVERELLAALVEAAARGESGAVLVLGEPGIGKSALLDDVAAVAVSAEVRVLRTQGLEQEAPLAFGALQRLLRPVSGFLDRVHGPQGRALRLAFGLESGESVDPFLVGVATLSLLSSAAEEATLACLVDDAHWLDSASADALLFAARRLQADRVAMVFAAREPREPSFVPEGVQVVRLSGLDDADARAVLGELHGRQQLDADVVDRLLAAADGNPLALRSLPTALSAAQLTGTASLPEQLAPGEGLQRVLLQQVRRLPEAAQTVLLVAACDDFGEQVITRAAAARLGVEDGWEAAERSGLLVVTESAMRISHPLVRSAISGAATSTQRRAAHQALADAFLDAGDAARGVWHSAAASSGYDESLASALADLAARAADRGGLGLAADAYERAAELTRDSDRRAGWLLGAAAHAWATGQGARASRLAGTAREDSNRIGGGGRDPLLRADIDRLRGRIEVNTGSASKGQAIFVTAARAVAPHDPGRALDMAVAAALMRGYGIDSGLDLPERLFPTDVGAADVPRTACLKQLLETMGHANRGEWAKARLALGRALRYADTVSTDARDLDVWGNLGNAALAVGDDPAAYRCYKAMHAHALDTGSGMSIIYALHRIGFAQITAGQWGQIRAHTEDALALARSIGQPALTVTPVAWLTWLAALQGDAAYTELRGRLVGLTNAHPLGILAGPVRDLALWAAGAHAAADGDHGQALHHLARIQVPALRRMTALDRIDAAVRARRDPKSRAVDRRNRPVLPVGRMGVAARGGRVRPGAPGRQGPQRR